MKKIYVFAGLLLFSCVARSLPPIAPASASESAPTAVNELTDNKGVTENVSRAILVQTRIVNGGIESVGRKAAMVMNLSPSSGQGELRFDLFEHGDRVGSIVGEDERFNALEHAGVREAAVRVIVTAIPLEKPVTSIKLFFHEKLIKTISVEEDEKVFCKGKLGDPWCSSGAFAPPH